MKSSKIIITGAFVALVLAVVGGGVLFFKWLRDPERIAAAESERLITQHLAEPLDITSRIQTPASYFEQDRQFPAWHFVPTGSQFFCHIPLQIDGSVCLYGEGNASAGLKFPEAWSGIPMNQKFETLYVYHCAFYGSPNGTPVYDIVFRYEDGSSATNKIVYGDDVLDWYANRGKKVIGPTAARSKLAWHGGAGPGEGKQATRFCLTAVENPFPNTTVTAVDLYSCKSRTAACILAFTPGRAGLMQ